MSLLASRRYAGEGGYDVLSGPDAAYRRYASGIPKVEPWAPPSTRVSDLVLAHREHARSIARGIRRKYALWHVDADDLEQAAMEGLLMAAKRYDSARADANFAGFASLRIAGAVIDEIRKRDWVPYRENRRSAEGADRRLVSLDARVGALGDDGSALPEPAWMAAPDEDLDGWLDALDKLAGLRPREQYVALQYGAGYTFKEIGDGLGVSESRVWQLYARAMERIGVVPEKQTRRKRGEVDHGTVAMYGRGCRCEGCRKATSDARTRRRRETGASRQWENERWPRWVRTAS